jgi:outer membrane protein assembly factor BamB
MHAQASRRPAAAAVLLALGLAVSAAGQTGAPRRDWPMFGGSPARNLVNPFVKNLPTDWKVVWHKGGNRVKSRKNVTWVARLDWNTISGVVVAGGKVFIGTNNQHSRNPRDIDPKTGRPLDLAVLLCLRESDGKLLWQAVHDRLESGLANDWPRMGLRSVPAVEGTRLYYVSNRCELICADTEGFRDGKNDGVRDEKRVGPTDADVVWRLDMIKELGVFPHNYSASSPLVVGDLVFVVTANGVDDDHYTIPSPKAPSFVAVNKRTGKVVWQDNSPTINARKLGKSKDPAAAFRKLVDQAELVMHGQWSSPAYAVVMGTPQVVFPGGDGWLRAFEARTGKLLWNFDANPKDAQFLLGAKGTRSDFMATPVIYDNKVYVGLGQDPEHGGGVGHLWCIDMTRRGDVSPELVTNNQVWPPKTKPNPNSAVVWHYGGEVPAGMIQKVGRRYVFGRTLSTCAVHDRLVYAADMSGYLHCLDAGTGKAYWVHNLDSRTWASPLWADGKVYLGDESFCVHIFAHGREKKVLNVVELDSQVRGVPAAANGVLYIATQNYLYAIAND